MDNPSEFEKFYMCTDLSKVNGIVSIECKLGLWGVSAPTMEQAVDEAKHYFLQYLSDDEYSSIVGDKSDTELLE